MDAATRKDGVKEEQDAVNQRPRRLVVRREHEADVTASELLVNRREAVQLVLERGGVLRVEEALDQAAAVRGDTGALASDLRGVNEVLEDRLVHGGEGARVRTGLLVTVLAAGLAEDAALADEDNVAVRELLLELTGETVKNKRGQSISNQPERCGNKQSTNHSCLQQRSIIERRFSKDATGSFVVSIALECGIAELWRLSSTLRKIIFVPPT